jgi:photosystem II stability/assembly factor-like uncharacterized protein
VALAVARADVVPRDDSWLVSVGARGVFAVTRDGAYVSRTRGRRWSRLGPGGAILAADVGGPGRMLASDRRGGLIVSSDAGRTWASIALPDCARPTDGVAAVAGQRVVYAWGFGAMFSGDPSTGGIFVSRSAGASFEKVSDLQPDQLAVTATQPPVAYAATPGGLYRSNAPGGDWRPVEGLPSASVAGVSVAPDDPHLVFAVTETDDMVSSAGGVAGNTRLLWRSNDAGRHWTRLMEIFDVASITFAASEPRIVYLSGTRIDQTTATDVLLRSTDGGATWTRRWARPAGGATTIAEATRPTGPIAAGTVLVDATDPSVLYLQDRHGVLRSLDAGRSFHPLAIPGNP